ncbi:MAG: hypothetical protein L0Y74_08135 [candidate division Zixibacteria bacterium]|nr:hypothetical protein [candidate division Zixibacteria bacterium]
MSERQYDETIEFQSCFSEATGHMVTYNFKDKDQNLIGRFTLKPIGADAVDFAEGQTDNKEKAMALLFGCLYSWELPDMPDLELTRENLGKLIPAIRNKLLQKALEINHVDLATEKNSETQ